MDLLWNTPSVLARFEDTGPVTKEAAEELGLVGPAARACGLNRDVRFELPAGIWRFTHIPISCWHDGDVFARAYVRWLEIQRSADFILAQLESLPEGPIRSPVGPLAPDRFVVSMAEGWRGEICHVAITDERGRFAHYKVTDPSFHNWMGLALALRGAADFRFPAVQQELQPFVLRARFVRTVRMLKALMARIRQKHRTIRWPGREPAMPDRFRGRPAIERSRCAADCRCCVESCPTGAIERTATGPRIDLGRCLFCADCVEACPHGALRFTQEYRLAARERARPGCWRRENTGSRARSTTRRAGCSGAR